MDIFIASALGMAKKAGVFLEADPVLVNATNGDGGQTPLHLAASSGHLNVAKLLLNMGASINMTNSNGATPLYVASSQGRTGMVDLLLRSGAVPDLRERYAGGTPLHAAAEAGHADTVALLLSKGANASLRDASQQTALDRAAKRGNQAVVELLRGYRPLSPRSA